MTDCWSVMKGQTVNRLDELQAPQIKDEQKHPRGTELKRT